MALVADASTRALAGEAGIAAFASVADATSRAPSPAEPMTPPVPRSTSFVAPAARARQPAALARPPCRPLASRLDETQAVPIRRHRRPPCHGAGAAPSARGCRRAARCVPRAAGGVLILLLLAGAAFALVLPGATVTIQPDRSSWVR